MLIVNLEKKLYIYKKGHFLYFMSEWNVYTYSTNIHKIYYVKVKNKEFITRSPYKLKNTKFVYLFLSQEIWVHIQLYVLDHTLFRISTSVYVHKR